MLPHATNVPAEGHGQRDANGAVFHHCSPVTALPRWESKTGDICLDSGLWCSVRPVLLLHRDASSSSLPGHSPPVGSASSWTLRCEAITGNVS